MGSKGFIRGIWLSVALIGLLSLVAAGCQQAAPAPTSAPKAPAAAPTVAPAPGATSAAPTAAPAKPTAAAQPTAAPAAAKPTGKLIVAVDNFGTEATLPQEGTISSHGYWNAMYEFLFYRDKDGNPLPGLAAKWDISSDHLTWTLQLQRGVKFHSGDDFSAVDVKFTLDLYSDPKSVHIVTTQLRDNVDRVDVVDPYTISIHTKRPYSALPALLSDLHSPPIVSKKYIDRVGMDQARQKPVGTGPFKFVSLTKGQSIQFEAVENHWRQTAAFKDLEIRVVPEPATRLAMLKRGEADIVELPLSFKKEAQTSNVRTVSAVGFASTELALAGQYLDSQPGYDPQLPWLKKDVRQALNVAINRQEIVDNVFYGEAIPANFDYPLPGMPDYDASMKPYPYDPTKAKQLLASAGYPNGFPIEIKTYSRPGVPDLPAQGEAVAQYWKAIGVTAKLTPSDYATIRGMTQKREKTSWAALNIFGPVDDAIAYTSYATGTGPMFYTERLPQLKNLVLSAGSEFDNSKRLDTYRSVARALYDDYISVPIAFVNTMYGVSDKIGQWPVAAHYGPNKFEYARPR